MKQHISPEYYINKNDEVRLHTHISVSVILFLYFSEVIAALFKITAYQRYLIFIIPGYFLVRALFLLRNDFNISRTKVVAFMMLFASGIYIGYLKYYTEVSHDFILGLSHNAFFFQLFPLILLFAPIDIKTISNVLEKTSIILVFIASLYLILQNKLITSFIFTPSEIASWFNGVSKQYLAPPGFIDTIQVSAMTIVAYSAFLVIKILIDNNEKLTRKTWFYLYFILFISNYAVSLSDSITSSLIFLSFTLIVILRAGFINKKIFLSVILLFPITFVYFTGYVFRKLQRYMGTTKFSDDLTYREMIIDKFILITRNCDIKIHTEQQSPLLCANNEIHLLSGTMNYGLIPDLPRLLILFIPVILFALVFKYKRYKQYPLAIFGFILLLGSFHYPTITNWPNVFIYQIIVVALFRDYVNKAYNTNIA